MPRRELTAEEKEIYASDAKLEEYNRELELIGGEVGSERSAMLNAEKRVKKLRAEITESQKEITQRNKNVRGLKSRAAHLRDMKRKRKQTLTNQYYRDVVNPLRKKLGMPTLKPNTKDG